MAASDAYELTPVKPLSQLKVAELQKADKARRLVAEVARFYRGAVCLAFVGVSWDHKLTDQSGAEQSENLVRWSRICHLGRVAAPGDDDLETCGLC